MKYKILSHLLAVLLLLLVIITHVTCSNTTTSASSTSSSTSPSPTNSPIKDELYYAVQGCFYLRISKIHFTFTSEEYMDVDLRQLSTLFKNYTQMVEGCSENTKTFTRSYYPDSQHNKTELAKFWFKITFEHRVSDDSWRLVDLKSGNHTNGNSTFLYGPCGNAVEVPYDMSYYCSSLECNGHEQVDDNPAAVTLYNITIDPFVTDGKSHSQAYSKCGAESSSNKTAFVIVGLVIGITATLALIVILASFMYKRYRYGRYNLLD